VACSLPDLPASIRFKISSENGKAVMTQDQLADLAADVMAVKAWIVAAMPCLVVQP
jgi:hypothetical protein